MAVIDFAERRLNEESRAGNEHLVAYWAAYRDGAIQTKLTDITEQQKDDLPF